MSINSKVLRTVYISPLVTIASSQPVIYWNQNLKNQPRFSEFMLHTSVPFQISSKITATLKQEEMK